MRTVSGNRDRLVAIIEGLEADRRPGWGSLDVPRLVCHFNDVMLVALGETVPGVDPLPLLPKSWVKWMTVYSPLPWPKNLKTAKEFFLTPPETLDEDKAELVRRIDRFLALGEGFASAHPLFGTMTFRDWDHMLMRHFRWHFDQFGVER